MTVTEMTIPAIDLTPLIGSRIDTDIETLLSGRYARDIRALLASRVVLVFPEIGMTDEQQIAFTATLGTPANENNGYAGPDGKPQPIYRVDAAQNDQHAIRRLRNNFLWHLDGSMHEVPILASILSAKQVAPAGGETEWANTCAAFAALPEAERDALENLRVVHANWALARHSNPEPTYAEFEQSRRGPSKSQPLVWKHRSGRKSLVVGSTAAYVEGMEPLDSLDLLVRLRDWATQPQFVYRHEWKVGDMVMWDNTATLHRARPYELNCGRLMHRTVLRGEEPIA
ncbi:Taurine dioxygenase, alpha-ketoglutarate-dependent [Novosphingobium sp. CF614]|uniref:TauD/TfdA dioxygenase family protein n=1 Tax=Novosphingobium sp. CF614 TaxID=1884364 RepID=UPI0008EFD321|nr:TauD/TfdA family dioxygenase [Novosphingobium sp. CF614]SFF96325.1 Taurine dioxygenase, alpha-ketoglutarate-dependent [Novosphingobium sp. CF614]